MHHFEVVPADCRSELKRSGASDAVGCVLIMPDFCDQKALKGKIPRPVSSPPVGLLSRIYWSLHRQTFTMKKQHNNRRNKCSRIPPTSVVLYHTHNTESFVKPLKQNKRQRVKALQGWFSSDGFASHLGYTGKATFALLQQEKPEESQFVNGKSPKVYVP